jgi:MFS family permease
MRASPALLNIFAGYVINGAIGSTFWSWIASFLIRVHGVPVQEAGLLIAVGAGGCGFIGAILGALLADRAGRRGPKAVLYFCAVCAAVTAPLGIAMTIAPTLNFALVFMAVMSLSKSMYMGPAQGLILSIAKVRMRGVTATMMSVTATLVGYGLGPLLAGAISQGLGGGTAIRYGLGCLLALGLWAALHFFLGTRTLEAELTKATA